MKESQVCIVMGIKLYYLTKFNENHFNYLSGYLTNSNGSVQYDYARKISSDN